MQLNESLTKLETFRDDTELQFSVVYGPPKIKCRNPKEHILLILDSSFNPPHWGHYTLIERAIESYGQEPNVEVHVLLLLSVNNADKGEKPAAFDKRIDMMYLLSKTLKDEFQNLIPTVALCKSARFVDKSSDVRKNLFEIGKIVYLLGFDTITRVLDPKYYLPKTLKEAMGEFMLHTEFFCLTRGEEGKNDSQDIVNQGKYVEDISNGACEPTIPKEWGSKIKIEVNQNEYCSISSSSIRKDLMKRQYRTVENKLPYRILEYIRVNDEKAKSSIFI
ncbi:similar to Saccharomyces cerevisiae YCL047C POF1 Protein involved in the filamentation pathway [Maudiozyma barnettii]|uniref:Similar to Saccharomyces cerevisiae YCL047C POF1 Protein involved in the filamentation pathway n=1 Tax=Maudiozyma barnettii TaxID=61262 RepID=A0A8H2VDI5_9SACH|nr:nicotinamide-nucleotide adenylyltransferase [Kazachstania barnettii]CAB4253341.1 similar to Saccharomyces cerevisiae YCL047C POF1 Protein involved in the filamentation pathway [Kazachstania barnettii]CAD1780874.1 similar to Saccharomyces cerevisiae YCL047C POF1 Protein involved in the filamentation pathway [Kazachstania barnettii]